MNKSRRKELTEIIIKLENAQLELEELRSAEEEAFDNIPESLQEGKQGEKMQEALDAMQEAYDSIQSAIESIEEAINN